MNSKIRSYVEGLFSDIPRSKKALELKEELLANMSARFDDYIEQGKSESEAYTMVLASLGDIDELLKEVTPTDDFVKNAENFRKRNAKCMSISIAMYIVGAAILIAFAGVGELTQNEDFYSYIGVLIFLLIVAAATGTIVYIQSSTPLEYKDYIGGKKTQYGSSEKNQKNKVYQEIQSGFWWIVVALYLLSSFLTGRWGITWIIFIIAAAIHSVLNAIFEWREDE